MAIYCTEQEVQDHGELVKLLREKLSGSCYVSRAEWSITKNYCRYLKFHTLFYTYGKWATNKTN